MKKVTFLFSGIILALSSCSFLSGNNTNYLNDLWLEEYSDNNKFINKEDVINTSLFIDGKYIKEDKKDFDISQDNKIEFYNDSGLRFIDKTNGYALTINGEKPLIDYTLGNYGIYFNFKDSRMRVTHELNRYNHNKEGYTIYVTEWLDRYINNELYLKDNNLEYFKPTIYEDDSFLKGYVTTLFSIKINDINEKYYPYYNIALIRKEKSYSNFTLFVFKSKVNNYSKFIDILKSYKQINKKGSPKRYLEEIEVTKKSNWSPSTLKYYEKLENQKTFDFGVFSASLCNDNSENYDYIDKKVNEEKSRLEGINGLNHTYEILPTYTHIGWYNERHEFPNRLANKYARGNGFNNLPVLQFTYQFTTNNNKVNPQNIDDNYTPMFDILRGKYDEQFKKLALDIKNYKEPVLFRLNNEMNSDRTSYSGIMTLIDPEIFISTWRYLHDIFDEVGVNNCLWIFNPIHVSCPFSNWGEDLAYFPGKDYCDLIGLTSYEMNNETSTESFRTRYLNLFNKNQKVFKNYLYIISEFACGSGGETTGELYRNEDLQAKWVEDMFNEFLNYDRNTYLQNIKGAVWFGVNDYEDDKISNCLELSPNLTKTLNKFREGFKKIEDKNNDNS